MKVRLIWMVVAACAQDTPYRVGRDVSAPHVVSKKEPKYSEEARIAKLECTVTLGLVVGADGVRRTFE